MKKTNKITSIVGARSQIENKPYKSIRKKILGASLENCIHIAGLYNFLRIAEKIGFSVKIIGISVSIDSIIEAVKKEKPDILAVSYRLTPENGKKILQDFLKQIKAFPKIKLMFGGLPKLVAYARQTGRFTVCFKGDEPYGEIKKLLNYLHSGRKHVYKTLNKTHTTSPIIDKIERLPYIANGYHYPLLRHHFGLSSLEATVNGVKKISESEILDIISLAPDQNAQEFFFRPKFMNHQFDGCGGVPLRKQADLKQLWKSSQVGNYPNLRIYSGTQDLLKWAKLSIKTLRNAWGAVPLFWYSELDGRSKRTLKDAIKENQATIHLYATHGLPVEVLEAHQWSLREAPDSVAVAMSYIAAYNAKALGVKHYIAQFMFNTPSYTAPFYDLGKMLAKISLIESLRSDTFIPFRQVRPGLTFFSPDVEIARGQLISASLNMMALRPHILHVVGFSEADHAASPDEIISACKMMHGMLKNICLGQPELLIDKRVLSVRNQLLCEASWLLGTIHKLGDILGSSEPFLDPIVLIKAIEIGILDAPHLKGQPHILGLTETRPVAGGCKSVNRMNGKVLNEIERIQMLIEKGAANKILGSDAKKLIIKDKEKFKWQKKKILSRL